MSGTSCDIRHVLLRGWAASIKDKCDWFLNYKESLTFLCRSPIADVSTSLASAVLANDTEAIGQACRKLQDMLDAEKGDDLPKAVLGELLPHFKLDRVHVLYLFSQSCTWMSSYSIDGQSCFSINRSQVPAICKGSDKIQEWPCLGTNNDIHIPHNKHTCKLLVKCFEHKVLHELFTAKCLCYSQSQ